MRENEKVCYETLTMLVDHLDFPQFILKKKLTNKITQNYIISNNRPPK